MRITYLAATILSVSLLPLSAPAFASCNSTNCAPVGNSISYGSGSYGSIPSSTNYSSSAYARQGISTSYGTGNTRACPSGAFKTQNRYCMSTGSSSSVGSGHANSSSFRSSSHSSPRATGQVVPFTTTVSKISKYRVAGMAENEFLSPTTCPTNVYNPDGHKVLGCYSVVKPVQAVRPVQVVRPVPQIRYQQVRVVRPIIYVHYPVLIPMPVIMPMPMQMPAPVCRTQTVCNNVCNNTVYPRYGNAWPQVRNNCGRW